MIFSGVIKPTAVVINRGHSLLQRANASRNSGLSHALTNDSHSSRDRGGGCGRLRRQP